MSEEARAAELTSLETALKALVPSAGLDHDRLMFEAGRAAARPFRWIWPSVAAAGLLVSATLGTALAVRAPAERVVIVQVQAPLPPAGEGHSADSGAPIEHLTRANYLNLRDQLLRDGVDSLPPLPPVPAPPPPVNIKNLLDHPGSAW